MVSERTDIEYAKRGAYLPPWTAGGIVQRQMVDLADSVSFGYVGSSPERTTNDKAERAEARRLEKRHRALGWAGESLVRLCTDRDIVYRQAFGSERIAREMATGGYQRGREAVAKVEAQLRARDTTIEDARHSVGNILTLGGKVRGLKYELGNDAQAVKDLLDQNNVGKYDADTKKYMSDPVVLDYVMKEARQDAEAAGVHISEQVDVAENIQPK